MAWGQICEFLPRGIVYLKPSLFSLTMFWEVLMDAILLFLQERPGKGAQKGRPRKKTLGHKEEKDCPAGGTGVWNEVARTR